ncbi:MAG: dethiobiotin synthase [Planctomycetes bacterium]|nr:dethiobiotin synthase [Planctomycetota bacterium]
MKHYFVTGIGTDVGKTVVSAILVEALRADYWKPVQAGGLDHTDTDQVRAWISNPVSKFHAESYRLTRPMSPHAAAELEGIEISLASIKVPETDNRLIIEGVGGVMVPLNNEQVVADLIAQLGAEVIIVCQNYLGSINHSLLTIESLCRRGLAIRGIVFNGPAAPTSESIILARSGLQCLGRVDQEERIDAAIVSKYAERFSPI